MIDPLAIIHSTATKVADDLWLLCDGPCRLEVVEDSGTGTISRFYDGDPRSGGVLQVQITHTTEATRHEVHIQFSSLYVQGSMPESVSLASV